MQNANPHQHQTTSQDRYSPPREVPIDIAALHEFTRDSVHKAEDDLQASEEGFRASTRPFYENPERKRRGVGAVGWEVCYATIEGASQTRRGDDNANVIFGKEPMTDIQD